MGRGFDDDHDYLKSGCCADGALLPWRQVDEVVMDHGWIQQANPLNGAEALIQPRIHV